MPASISPAETPEIGLDCHELAVLPGACQDKDVDSFKFLQGLTVPSRFEKPESLLPSGATTPGEEASELEDQSDYEFNADGQEEYYDFLREMGCDFKQSRNSDEEDAEPTEEGDVFKYDELEEEVDVEFKADGQEEYYDFLCEMGCPFEERVAADKELEWNDNKWIDENTSSAHHSVAYVETPQMTYAPARSLLEEAGMDNQPEYDDDFCFGQFAAGSRSNACIAPGPSLWLQKALLSVAAQRKRDLHSMERSWEIIR